MRRLLAFSAVLMLAASPVAATAQEDPAVPELDIFGRSPDPRQCTAEPGNTYEAAQYSAEGWAAGAPRYGTDCRRLRFVFGPIHTKPGQNDVLIEPVTIQKPAFDGYVVRFKPNLVDAQGNIPGVHEIHLHHAVWLNLVNNYGNGSNPFFATGEEKTILNIPKGYGLPVRASDTWQILYMIHNQDPTPRELFITYEIDIVPNAAAAPWNIKPVYPVWLDVRPSFYPVFNAKRDFPAPGATTCTWPDENCADHDPWGDVTCKQGAGSCTYDDNGFRFPAKGESFGRRVTNFQGGTLVHMAGHLHPGGLTVQVDHERGTNKRRIFTSEGVYWNHGDHVSRDGPPTSWDMSMTAVTLPEWGVRVKPSDRLRISATYDVSRQSTYENMGIVVAWMAPHTAAGTPTAPGLDPFDDAAATDTAPTCPSGGLQASPRTLCEKGDVTHGHLAEAEVYGGANVRGLPSNLGPLTSRVTISGFNYSPGGHGTLSITGIPKVTPGTTRFFNADAAAANIYHSVTSCAYPCTGTTGIAYPLSDGLSKGLDGAPDAPVDFDSGQLGIGPPEVGPAKNELSWTLPESGFSAGIYTYFCRVHPSMRGAFAVEGGP